MLVEQGLMLAACVVAMVSADTMPPQSWTVSDYPTPTTQGELCGPGRGGAMYVCDPNSLLSVREAQQLEGLIMRVMNTTSCPCARSVCDQPSSPGYRIGVALLRRMNGTTTENRGVGSRIRNNLHNAKVFAYTFLNRWGLGRCSEDLIILYSQDDTVLYTETGQETSRVLDSDLVAEISKQVQIDFAPNRDKFQGLKKMILNYEAVFNGNYERMEHKIVTPKYDAVVGGSSKVATFTLMTLTLTLLAALF